MVVDTLRRLMAIEREISLKDRALEHHEVKAALDELRVRLRDTTESSARLGALVSSLALEESQIESEVEALRHKLSSLQAHSKGDLASDFRGADALEHQIDATVERLEQLEMNALELLESQELQQGLADDESRLRDDLEAQVAILTEQWNEMQAAWKRERGELQVQLEAALGELDPEGVVTYRRIAKQGGGLVIAQIVGDRCEVCSMTFSRYELDRIRHHGVLSKVADVPRCEECGSLLLIGDPI